MLRITEFKDINQTSTWRKNLNSPKELYTLRQINAQFNVFKVCHSHKLK